MQVEYSQYSTGPIPSPELLEQYESVHPGAAKWILQSAQLQAEHRRQIENRASKTRNYGIAAMILFMFPLAGYTASLGHPWVAGLVIAACGSVIYAFGKE